MNNQESQYEKEYKRYILLAMIITMLSLLVSSLIFLLSTNYSQESHDQNSNSVMEDTITPPETDTIIVVPQTPSDIIHSADEKDEVSPANPKQSE